MTIASTAFLVDTNVLVYAEDAADPAKRVRSVEILERLTLSAKGVLSVQVLNEFFAVVTRGKRRLPPRLTKEQAEARCNEFAASWTVLELSLEATKDAMRACRTYSLSYWDALIWSTARLNGVGTLLTEDMQDGRLIEGVRILNPLNPAFDLARLD
jgi:predicted nucleic acid-binding protein